jgi:hypothetical protein
MRLRVPKNRREDFLRAGEELEEGASSGVLSGRFELELRTEAILRMLRERSREKEAEEGRS